MKLSDLQQEVAFDQFSRQYQVTFMLDTLRAKGESYTILDVGGYKGRTKDFLPQDKVTILDLFNVKEEDYVQGSGLDMPFEDSSFDFVVSFDVMEHIEAKDRHTFFDECNRLAKRGVIICAPHKTVANQQVETSLNNLYEELHHKPHEWLSEHIAYGLPDFDDLDRYATRKGLMTTFFHSNKTQLWQSMQQAIFLNSKFPLASEELIKANLFYNQHFMFDGGGQAEAAYRLILACFRKIQDVKTAAGLTAHNAPLDPLLEVDMYSVIGNFNMVLAKKTDALAKDYKALHEHERQRAETLQVNNEALWEQVTALQSHPNQRLRNKLRASSPWAARNRSKPKAGNEKSN